MMRKQILLRKLFSGKKTLIINFEEPSPPRTTITYEFNAQCKFGQKLKKNFIIQNRFLRKTNTPKHLRTHLD